MKTEPHRAELNSATLTTAEYDFNLAQLVLDFQDGSRYLYSGVQSPVFADLLRASLQGTFFNRKIRSRYPYVRIW